MPKLKVISGKKLVAILEKFDFEVDHQTGSHIILRQKFSPYRRITVPNHDPISIGTLSAIIKQAGLTRDEIFKTK